ncbi:hypothetical protein [Spirosoma rhododendri]|uniref:Uncharacterized protein n=1 Tax=Spirosoma rhododendri TaxID=2728024 RepID=A0A7L5DKR5_9BACT|nr:hypothetical protein [Spirosoma rhododendri]QJD76988.1 hypothetical protein HH216_00095 [Spirosoma rhododendri]
MRRRVPPIIQFIFYGMIAAFVGALAGLIHEFLQKPFDAANAVVWLFLMGVSGGIVTLVLLYIRNRLG